MPTTYERVSDLCIRIPQPKKGLYYFVIGHTTTYYIGHTTTYYKVSSYQRIPQPKKGLYYFVIGHTTTYYKGHTTT